MTASFAYEQHREQTLTLHQKLRSRTKHAAGNNVCKTQVNYTRKAHLAGGLLETLEPVVPGGLVLSQVDSIREVGGNIEQHWTTDQRLREPIQLKDVKL